MRSGAYGQRKTGGHAEGDDQDDLQAAVAHIR
jgi:hypothetical protein